MSLIIPRNFKRAKAQDAAAQDANDDSILRLCKPGNVVKKAKMGNLHEVRYGAGYIYPLIGRDKVLLKVFGSLSEANRSPLVAADSIAADAKFKVGDKVRRGKQIGIVRGIEKEPYIEVKFTDEPVTVFVHESEIVAADSRAEDGNSEFELGMKVFKAIGKVEDEIGAGVRRAKQLVNNVPDEDVRRRLNRKLDDIEKIADSFEDTFI